MLQFNRRNELKDGKRSFQNYFVTAVAGQPNNLGLLEKIEGVEKSKKSPFSRERFFAPELYSLLKGIFNVPFGEWEKIPRLQAKTLVGLRCHGKLPQDLTFRLRSEIPPGMDHQVPQAGFLWRRGRSVTGTHP